jgi:hypothetical protein
MSILPLRFDVILMFWARYLGERDKELLLTHLSANLPPTRLLPALLLTYPSLLYQASSGLCLSISAPVDPRMMMYLTIPVFGHLLTSLFTKQLTSSYFHPPSSFPAHLPTYQLTFLPWFP